MSTSTPQQVINLSLRNDCFPNDLKSREVNPIFKKDNHLENKIYRLAPQETADLATVTEDILNGKLLFLCNVISVLPQRE